MKKSVGDNLIPKDWTLENGLALIRKAGFDGVELWLGDKPWFQLDIPTPRCANCAARWKTRDW